MTDQQKPNTAELTREQQIAFRNLHSRVFALTVQYMRQVDDLCRPVIENLTLPNYGTESSELSTAEQAEN